MTSSASMETEKQGTGLATVIAEKNANNPRAALIRKRRTRRGQKAGEKGGGPRAAPGEKQALVRIPGSGASGYKSGG